MTRELVLWLLQQGHEPRHLTSRSAAGEDVLTLGLKEAIHLREQGQAQLSLALLQRMQQAGLQSPWINDNAARALVDVGQPQLALAQWRRLRQDPDEAVQRVASDTLQQVLRPFMERLHELCANHHWSIRHLPAIEAAGDGDLLLQVLNEAIAAREANRPDLSLALIGAALERGWSSPWLQDNQARALVHQGRRDEACSIWETLQHHEDSTAADEARKMLGQYQPARISHPVRDRVRELEQAGQSSEAEAVLLDGLVMTPDDELLWTLLQERQPAESQQASALLDQELADVNRRLAAQERFLAHLEALLTKN